MSVSMHIWCFLFVSFFLSPWESFKIPLDRKFIPQPSFFRLFLAANFDMQACMFGRVYKDSYGRVLENMII